MSTREPRKDILVYDMPDEIREALVADAKEQNISINDAAVKILAKRFRVRFVSTGASYADGTAKNLAVRAGESLHRKIDIERAKRSGTLRGIVLETLALHFNLTPPPVGRRRRRTAKEAATT